MQRRNNVTRVLVELRSRDKGRRKNAAFRPLGRAADIRGLKNPHKREVWNQFLQFVELRMFRDTSSLPI